MRGLIANAWMIRTDGAGLLALAQQHRHRRDRRDRRAAPDAGAGRDRRQHDPAPPGVVGRAAEAETSARSRPAPASSGFFGKQAAANFVKGLFKLIALGAVMTAMLWPERASARSDGALRSGGAARRRPRRLTLQLLGAVVAMLAVVAIADYFFQYRQWYERQKMSLQEMKEEFKQSEGDPHIKGTHPAIARRRA